MKIFINKDKKDLRMFKPIQNLQKPAQKRKEKLSHLNLLFKKKTKKNKLKMMMK